MDNTYPNNEFIRRTANFRDELEAFLKTTDDEGNPNPDYTFEDQKKLYEAMMNKAYDLALFIESLEVEGYRLIKAGADPVQAVMPDGSPLPTVDDDPFVFDDNGESDYVPPWLIDEDDIEGSELAYWQIEDDPDKRSFTLTDQARAWLATLHEPVSVTDYPVQFEAVEVVSMGDNQDD